MKRFILLVLVLLSSTVYADFPAVRNDSAATTLTGTDGQPSMLSVDSTGRLFINSGTGATSLGKAEDSAHTSGDVGTMCLGVRNDTFASTTSVSGDYGQISISDRGAVFTEVIGALSSSAISNFALLKAEDSAGASADVGVNIMSLRQDTISNVTSNDGDYAAIKSDFQGSIYVHEMGGPSNGLTLTGITSAATNNSTNVKASAGTLFTLSASNTTATIKYVKLYNKASAPTCGTDTPVYRIGVPATATVTIDSTPIGLSFGTGIGYCIVTGAGDSDNTAVAANDIFLNIGYK